MTEKEIEQVRVMWLQGCSMVQISRLLPYKEYLALAEIRTLKKQGILPPRNVQQIIADRVFKEYEETKDIGEIADRLGISKRYIENIFYHNGKYHPKLPSKKKQEIIADLKAKKSQSEIARNHGVSRQYIYQIKEQLKNG